MKRSEIHLGYAVPSGAAVEIPLRHMAVCGQTQEAGKTTALEALITRAGVRALTFITKRGEASFTSARRIDPYFREQADWQFVSSILEASRGEKLKFERAWIIRASKGARTLADVQGNVRKAMETAKGLAGDVYLTLDAYLEVVVPAIARVRWAPRVELAAGVNAMDLTALTIEMQHLVIKSSLDWVLEHGTDTVVVVPEAWKFIPQGRGTPVKLAAAAFIRQGAGLKNFLWLDSQDLGGIEKEILRSVPVWILGVQREANEIKRTLENIPAGITKPSKAAIATLELGQFFACWKTHAIRTYAQPAWMNADLAQKVATGALDVGNAAAIAGAANVTMAARRVFQGYDPVAEAVRRGPRIQEATVTKDEAARLTRENERLRAENEQLRAARQTISGEPIPAATRAHKGAAVPPAAAATPRIESWDEHEGLYQAFKARLCSEASSDPILLRVLLSRPELEVQVTRRTVTADAGDLGGRVALLFADGWFDQGKGATATCTEMKRRGWDHDYRNIAKVCDRMTTDGFFVREDGSYVAVKAAKVRVVEA